jgi:hypothetical protein
MKRKKKLLVILGAGSSVAQGMPSVSAIDAQMALWASSWAASNPGCTDYYARLRTNAVSYYSYAPPGLQRTPNFEKLLNDLISLANWLTPAPYGETLRPFVGAAANPPGITFGSSIPAVPGRESSITAAQAIHLLSALANEFRSRSRSLNRSAAAFIAYRSLMERFSEDFELGIYNLNYDNVAHSALPGAFTGFDPSGRPAPSTVHTREEWDFLYHLHGSVHHTLELPIPKRIRWQEDLGATFDDGSVGSSPLMVPGDRFFPRTTLIAGGWKLDQLLPEPYQTFYSSLVRHSFEADAVLIGGFGFSDMHVNFVLRNRFASGLPPPPIMILDWAAPSVPADPIAFRNDEWTSNIGSAIPVNLNEFHAPGHSSPMAANEISAIDSFDTSRLSDPPVAIWYGGFEGAIRRVNEIVQWLSGDRSALA